MQMRRSMAGSQRARELSQGTSSVLPLDRSAGGLSTTAARSLVASWLCRLMKSGDEDSSIADRVENASVKRSDKALMAAWQPEPSRYLPVS